MRIGDNPGKLSPLEYRKPYHRVILPVYIQEGGWFEATYDTMVLCIESLQQTIHAQTGVTVIANACSEKVMQFLLQKNKAGIIDQLIINHENKGKVDPLISVMKGCREGLITISDCDVLFKAGWQHEVEKIFYSVPRVGLVSPMPAPNMHHTFTAWAWYFGFTKGRIKRMTNQDRDSIIAFRKSIGTSDQLTEIEEHPFYLFYKDIVACFGCGHFCATYSKEVIPYLPMNYSGPQITNAELHFLDLPVEHNGFLRLATAKGYVYHMGNVAEPWMYDVLKSNEGFTENTIRIQLTKGYPVKGNLWYKAIGKLLGSSKSKKLKTKLYNIFK